MDLHGAIVRSMVTMDNGARLRIFRLILSPNLVMDICISVHHQRHHRHIPSNCITLVVWSVWDAETHGAAAALAEVHFHGAIVRSMVTMANGARLKILRVILSANLAVDICTSVRHQRLHHHILMPYLVLNV